ncbi:GyrI-like domain-containing protein [Paenibacillus soyae]|uniref:GyrI-like domain-containing protein n=1 Tax=Paenibacillus soyae TaxID=2969249 RepID=A0A9X2MSW3_9BACL|nr:GyrI-like domain-containing protein [Paenibacillus soyae]
MEVKIVQTGTITAYIGVRASSAMSDLGESVARAFDELLSRRDEIMNIKNPQVTYGITPPNYKGNAGSVDFYCCFEVEPIGNVPHGMVHLHLLPRMYTVTHYAGPSNLTEEAYDYTSRWIKENGFAYDDVAYYIERYDEKTIFEADDARSEIQIFCPVKRVEKEVDPE